MFRAAAILALAIILSTVPVGLPAEPVSSEDLRSGPQGPEAAFVLELVAELAAH